MENSKRPLDGIVVLDFTQALSGPACTLILADYGARVIKVESIKGSEPTRGNNYDPDVPPDRIIGGDNFNAINRNKDSISLDTRSSEGKNVIHRLVKKADVVISNYRPGTTEQMGIDYDTLKALNPAIICCEINGFREKGREGDPAFDVVVQAASGILASTGYPGQPPAKVGASVTDMVSGLFMVQGIMFALYERMKTGTGQFVNVRMQDAAMFLLAQYVTPCLGLPWFDVQRNGMCHTEATPSNGYETSDGYILIAPASDKLFLAFCDVIEKPELKNDARFNVIHSRAHHRKELDEILVPMFRTKSTDEWFRLLSKADLPCSPIRTPKQAFQKAYEDGSDIIKTISHPKRGDMHFIGTVIDMSRTPPSVTKPGPYLGQHTAEVLRELGGYSGAEIDALEAEGVIFCYKEAAV